MRTLPVSLAAIGSPSSAGSNADLSAWRMAANLIELDHFMVRVDDMPGAVERFSRMGFDFTPHSDLERLKVANRLMLLWPKRSGAANFIELMTITDAEKVHPVMAEILSAGEGLKMIVHLASNIDEFIAAMREREIRVHPTWDIDREWLSPSGERERVRFRVAIPRPGQAPFMFNAYEPSNIDQYLQDRYRHHHNGARHVAAITGRVTEDRFDETVRFYEQLYEVPAERPAVGLAEIKPRDVALRIATPRAARDLYPASASVEEEKPGLVGITVEVVDIAALESLFAANGVPSVRCAGREAVLVGPEYACGVMLEFVPL
jgi:hypothetical protein